MRPLAKQAGSPATCVRPSHPIPARLQLPLWCLLALIFLSISPPVSAAGPKAGQPYVAFGGGLFNPLFTLPPGSMPIDGDTDGELTIVLGDIPLLPSEITIGTDGQSNANQVRAENRGLLAIGITAGYQFTDELGAELGLDLGFPNITLHGPLLNNVLSNNPESLNIRVAPPSLLPITVTGTYTMFPYAAVSPYIGGGAMLALLDNRRSYSGANDVLVLEGGVEVGYVLQLGLKLDVSEVWYAFLDVKYGRIDDPKIEDVDGNDVDVDKFEVRNLRFGMGIPF